jgi:hypothetical protein
VTRRQAVPDDATVDALLDRAGLYQLTPAEAAQLVAGIARLRRQRGAAATRSRRAAAAEHPAVAAVRALHTTEFGNEFGGLECGVCREVWPCATIAAIDGPAAQPPGRTRSNAREHLEAELEQAERQLALARGRIAALHEGEEPYEDERATSTPAQWIWQWNRDAPEERLARAEAAVADAQHTLACSMNHWPERARESEAQVAAVYDELGQLLRDLNDQEFEGLTATQAVRRVRAALHEAAPTMPHPGHASQSGRSMLLNLLAGWGMTSGRGGRVIVDEALRRHAAELAAGMSSGTYRAVVNAPLSEATVHALNTRTRTGTLPHRTVTRGRRRLHTAEQLAYRWLFSLDPAQRVAGQQLREALHPPVSISPIQVVQYGSAPSQPSKEQIRAFVRAVLDGAGPAATQLSGPR